MFVRKMKTATTIVKINPKDTYKLIRCLKEADAIQSLGKVMLLPVRMRDEESNWIDWREINE